jgi:DNA-directed RNA polymerase beta' subunit
MMKNRGISLQDLSSVLLFKDADIKIKDDEIEITANEIDNIDLFKFERQVLSTDIKGIRNIDRVLIDQRDGEWVINTTGSNLIEVLKVQGIDSNRTITNDIHEMAETLGIESARNLIIREAVSVLEEQGLDVDIRHVMLVADAMTSSGAVLQIGRHGLSGKKDSVLARAAFEITVPTLVAAASKGSIDLLGGVTESVIVGQRVPIGTGLIELFMGPSYNAPLKMNGLKIESNGA